MAISFLVILVVSENELRAASENGHQPNSSYVPHVDLQAPSCHTTGTRWAGWLPDRLALHFLIISTNFVLDSLRPSPITKYIDLLNLMLRQLGESAGDRVSMHTFGGASSKILLVQSSLQTAILLKRSDDLDFGSRP